MQTFDEGTGTKLVLIGVGPKKIQNAFPGGQKARVPACKFDVDSSNSSIVSGIAK